MFFCVYTPVECMLCLLFGVANSHIMVKVKARLRIAVPSAGIVEIEQTLSSLQPPCHDAQEVTVLASKPEITLLCHNTFKLCI